MDKNNKKICVCLENAEAQCAKCGSKYYCSRDCQIKDWPVHKTACAAIELRNRQKKFMYYVNNKINGNILIVASHNPGNIIFVEIDELIHEFTSASGDMHFAYINSVAIDNAIEYSKLNYNKDISGTLPKIDCKDIQIFYIFRDDYLYITQKIEPEVNISKLKNKYPKPDHNWPITFDI